MINSATNVNYGFSGFSTAAYDEFLGLGKKGRKRRKERRKRKSMRKNLRTDKMRIKNQARKADAEAVKAQTAIMRSTMGLTTAPVQQGDVSENYRQKNHPKAYPPPPQLNPDANSNQDNTLMYVAIGVGVCLLVGGMIAISKKKARSAYYPDPSLYQTATASAI